jgi:hypothetical protein
MRLFRQLQDWYSEGVGDCCLTPNEQTFQPCHGENKLHQLIQFNSWWYENEKQ